MKSLARVYNLAKSTKSMFIWDDVNDRYMCVNHNRWRIGVNVV